MAVDYFHRLIVLGPAQQLDEFRRALTRSTSRRLGRKIIWTDRTAFSFAALYEIAPGVRRIEREFPGEPYDVSVWPVVRRGRGKAEIRYQLHTRDMELFGFLRVLSRLFPRFEFRLSTHCLDVSEIAGYQVINGHVRRWILPGYRRDFHWERARKKFGLAGEAVWEDDAATLFAEDGMCDEALDHWDPQVRRRTRKRARQWWNRPAARDFMTEREMDLIEINEKLLAEEASSERRRSSRPSKSRRSPRARRRPR